MIKQWEDDEPACALAVKPRRKTHPNALAEEVPLETTRIELYDWVGALSRRSLWRRGFHQLEEIRP
jgi:hypothetical protein